tara:strand:- start:686 stop:802 length:117 start_codon:yes stop_codon:yes gene_type:complete
MNARQKQNKMWRLRAKYKKAKLKGERPTIMDKVWGEEE